MLPRSLRLPKFLLLIVSSFWLEIKERLIIFTQTRILSIRLLIFTEGIFLLNAWKLWPLYFQKYQSFLSAQTDCSDFLPAISGNSLVWVLSFRPAVSLSLKCTGGGNFHLTRVSLPGRHKLRYRYTVRFKIYRLWPVPFGTYHRLLLLYHDKQCVHFCAFIPFHLWPGASKHWQCYDIRTYPSRWQSFWWAVRKSFRRP